jgi:hypothetical protein
MIDVSKELISSFTVEFVVGGSIITDVSKKIPASCIIGPLRRQALYHIETQLCPEYSTMNTYSCENLRSNTVKLTTLSRMKRKVCNSAHSI